MRGAQKTGQPDPPPLQEVERKLVEQQGQNDMLQGKYQLRRGELKAEMEAKLVVEGKLAEEKRTVRLAPFGGGGSTLLVAAA